jgi:hypothetical protein
MVVMKSITKFTPMLLVSALLGACTMVPAPDSTPPQPQGYAVPLDVAVRVGDLSVTPVKVVEDSRCPMNARCIWAGRVVVTTRIAGNGWADTADLTLGETYGTHGHTIALVSARPEKSTQAVIGQRDYRFAYEAR